MTIYEKHLKVKQDIKRVKEILRELQDFKLKLDRKILKLSTLEIFEKNYTELNEKERKAHKVYGVLKSNLMNSKYKNPRLKEMREVK